MKAVLVIDVDKDELGEAVATITAEENNISFFARGVIRPLPSFKAVDLNDTRDVVMFCHGWNTCLAEITGETE